MPAIKTTVISILAIGLLAGSAVGVAAQDEEGAALEASAAFRMDLVGIPFLTADAENPDELSDLQNIEFHVDTKATDPRASGRMRFAGETGEIGDEARPPWYAVHKTGVRIDNDAGAWVGTAVGFVFEQPDERTKKQKRKNKPKAPPKYDFSSFTVLTGEDGYEGLTMYLTSRGDGDRYVGVIVPTEVVPTQPEPPAE